MAVDTEILLHAGTNEVEIFEFKVGDRSFGVNVAKVHQIIRREGLTINRADKTPKGVIGTLIFRSKPILAVSLNEVLGVDPTDEPPERKLVLVTEFNHIMTGFFVDAAVRIHRISWKRLEPFDDVMSQAIPHVTGVVELEGRLIMVLDLEAILAEIAPESGIGSDAKLAGISRRGDRAHKKVLFAEDSPLIRKTTLKQLNAAGFENVSTANDGLQAYEKVKELKELAMEEARPFSSYLNLILTDIEMPAMDGLTFCRKVKKELELDVPIVVYSSLINEQMITKCESVGANGWMAKPQVDEIIKIMDEVSGS